MRALAALGPHCLGRVVRVARHAGRPRRGENRWSVVNLAKRGTRPARRSAAVQSVMNGATRSAARCGALRRRGAARGRRGGAGVPSLKKHASKFRRSVNTAHALLPAGHKCSSHYLRRERAALGSCATMASPEPHSFAPSPRASMGDFGLRRGSSTSTVAVRCLRSVSCPLRVGAHQKALP